MPENSTVRVIINAVTEAAEQSIEDVGDEISELSGDATVSQTAMDQLSDEFSEATKQSMVLQTAMDELDDEIGDVGNTSLYAQTALDQFNDEVTETTGQAGAASGALSSMAASMNLSAAASSALSMAFWVSLIPAIATLSTMLAPLVALVVALTAGATALAGAFGLIVGSGILAFGQQKAEQNEKELAQTKQLIAQYESLKEQTGALSASEQSRLKQLREKKKRLEDSTTAMGALKRQMAKLRDELLPLITEFGEEFIPLIEDGIDAIPTLVENMLDAVGGTGEFKEALRDFGAAMMEVLPALTAFMWELARTALPYAREFFSYLMDNGGDAMDAIFESVAELEPEFRDLLDALIDFGPELLEFGTNVSEVVLPAITDFINKVEDLLEWFNGLDDGTQDIIISLLVLGPVLLKVMKWIMLLKGALVGKGLISAFGKLATTLAGGGAVSTASVYGAAVIAGAGLGVLAVKALDAFGALQKVGEAGGWVREQLGGEVADTTLTGANFGTGGGLELFSKFGGVVRGVALPGKTVGGQLEKIDSTFEQAKENTLTPDSERSTDQTRSELQSNPAAREGLQQPDIPQQGDIEIQVDAEGELANNPFQWSRKAAQQLQRETRQQYGSSR